MTIMEQIQRANSKNPPSPYEALEQARNDALAHWRERHESDDMPKFKLSSEVRIKK